MLFSSSEKISVLATMNLDLQRSLVHTIKMLHDKVTKSRLTPLLARVISLQ